MAGQSSKPATATDVARWMVQELEREEYIYQNVIVHEIAARFGSQFTYDNRHGNLAIDRHVLDAFRNLTGDSVVWDNRQRMWRKRLDYDEPGRRKQS